MGIIFGFGFWMGAGGFCDWQQACFIQGHASDVLQCHLVKGMLEFNNDGVRSQI